jgi:hypothetical protein
MVMTQRSALREKVERRRSRERDRVAEMAEERWRAVEDLRRCEARLVTAAVAGELSQREVAAIAGVPRSTLLSWGER